MKTVTLLYMVCKNQEEAQQISRKLLEEKLVVCAQIFPQVQSVFEWEGKVCEESEVPVLLKTLKSKLHSLDLRIRELHSYQVPAILEIPLGFVSKPYEDWAIQQ